MRTSEKIIRFSSHILIKDLNYRIRELARLNLYLNNSELFEIFSMEEIHTKNNFKEEKKGGNKNLFYEYS